MVIGVNHHAQSIWSDLQVSDYWRNPQLRLHHYDLF